MSELPEDKVEICKPTVTKEPGSSAWIMLTIENGERGKPDAFIFVELADGTVKLDSDEYELFQRTQTRTLAETASPSDFTFAVVRRKPESMRGTRKTSEPTVRVWTPK